MRCPTLAPGPHCVKRVMSAFDPRSYIENIPGAVSGDRGHDNTFAVACRLARAGLAGNDILLWLREYNRKCDPCWSDAEIAHKVHDALAHANGHAPPNWKPLRAAAPKPDPARMIAAFLRGKRTIFDGEIFELSPVELTNKWAADAALFVETLYQPRELVNFVTDYAVDAKGKASPKGKGITVAAEALAAKLRTGWLPESQAGPWLRMNAVNGKGVSDTDISAFRFGLLEFDHVPKELQLNLLARLPLAIAGIFGSGGRSWHAWVRIDADDEQSYRQATEKILGLLSRFGADPKNKNPARLSRFPNGMRFIRASGSGRQSLIYLNPTPNSKGEAIIHD